MRESNTVEFKLVVNKSILKEIVAFANTLGGKLYIDVNDDGKPYYLTEKGMKPSGVYKRQGNTSVPVSDNDIRDMIMEYHGMTYEGTRSLNQELTFQYAAHQFKLRELTFEPLQMKSLGLYEEDGLYNNLALLLSDQCPHIIKAAVFKGDDKMDFTHRQEFAGSILKQLDDAYQFLEMQNHLLTTYEGLRRIDAYNYNPTAIREGLLNAIVHRDYGISGNIFINVFRSSIEFISLGSLPKGIRLEDIYEGVSKPRNEKLAGVFYRLQLIEAFGTGIMKIMGAYKEKEIKPEIKVTPGAFILRLPNMAYDSQSDRIKEQAAPYQSQAGLNLKDTEAVLMDILETIKEQGNISRLEVQEKYGFGQTKSGGLLRELENRDMIVKKGKGKNSYYVISRGGKQ